MLKTDRRGALTALVALATGAVAGRVEPALAAFEHEAAAGTLRYYNWPDYDSPRTYAGFTKATRIAVEKSYFASNEALYNRLRTGSRAYDLATPTGYMVAILAAEGLLEKIDWNRLPNVTKSIDPKFQGLPYDPADTWSVPKDWATTGFVYRTDLIGERPTTWSEFFRLFRRHPRRFTLLDDPAEVIGSIAVMMGHSYNTDSEHELAEVKRFLLGLKPYVHSIDSATYKEQIVSGRAYGGMGWNGDGAYVVARSPRSAARYVVAEEGGEFWVDAYVIPKGARNRAAAHAWIDFVYRPKWSAEETAYTYFGSPLRRRLLQGSVPATLLRDRSLFPAPATMRHLEANAVSAKGEELRRRIWSAFTGA